VRMSAAEAGDDEIAEGFAVCELCFTQATEEEIAAAEMIVPHAGEELILDALQVADPSTSGSTIIAYCLLAPSAHPESS
jgi:hypothetical protein